MRRRPDCAALSAKVHEPAHRLPIDLANHLDEIRHAVIGRAIDVAEIDDGPQQREDDDRDNQQAADRLGRREQMTRKIRLDEPDKLENRRDDPVAERDRGERHDQDDERKRRQRGEAASHRPTRSAPRASDSPRTRSCGRPRRTACPCRFRAPRAPSRRTSSARSRGVLKPCTITTRLASTSRSFSGVRVSAMSFTAWSGSTSVRPSGGLPPGSTPCSTLSGAVLSMK